MIKFIYLDKISSTPHFPDNKQYLAHNSTHVYPDMNHVEVKCKFGTDSTSCLSWWKRNDFCLAIQAPRTTAPNGRLSKVSKAKAYEDVLRVERERVPFEAREQHFIKTHHAFMDNILQVIDKSCRNVNKETEESWTEKYLEYDTAFDGNLSKQHHDKETVPKSKSRGSVYQGPGLTSLSCHERHASNRADLFSCLLDTVEPPKGKVQRFATLYDLDRATPGKNFSGCNVVSVSNPDQYSSSSSGKRLGSTEHMSATLLSPPPPSRGISTGASKWDAESIYQAHHGMPNKSKTNVWSSLSLSVSVLLFN